MHKNSYDNSMTMRYGYFDFAYPSKIVMRILIEFYKLH